MSSPFSYKLTFEDLANSPVALPNPHVRGVVTANVADLTAFTVAGNDGLTYAEGERLLLTGQSTAAQNGIYRVGSVASGTAKLYRPGDFFTGRGIQNGRVVEVAEGTIYAGSSWRATCTGAKVVDTDNPLFVVRGASAASVGSGASTNVRGVVAANVADLSAFTVAGNDGLTYTAGQRVLLVLQTTPAQNGIYVVGTVTAGTAPLTRAADAPAGAAVLNGRVVEVSEGTLYAGSSWKAMCTGACVWGTDDPLFYPRSCRAIVALSSGTKTLGATEGLWLFSATNTINATLNTPANAASTIQYNVPSASRVAGKVGVASVVVNALVAAGTVDSSNTSTVDVTVNNW